MILCDMVTWVPSVSHQKGHKRYPKRITVRDGWSVKALFCRGIWSHSSAFYWCRWSNLLRSCSVSYITAPKKFKRRGSLIHEIVFYEATQQRAQNKNCSSSAMKGSKGSFVRKTSTNSQILLIWQQTLRFPVVRGSFKTAWRTLQINLGICDFGPPLSILHRWQPRYPLLSTMHRTVGIWITAIDCAVFITEDLIKYIIWSWTIKTK